MKKLEVSEEFVKEAYESACQTWKLRIEEEFPSLFDREWQIGKWHKLTWEGNEAFVYSTGRVENGGTLGYGFLCTGEWLNDGLSWGSSSATKRELATSTEIESMLWKEAEKRGYKKGVTISCGERVGVIEGDFYWAEGSNCLSVYTKLIQGKELNPNLPIMHEGKWSEIIDPNKEIKETIERLEKELKELKEKVK